LRAKMLATEGEQPTPFVLMAILHFIVGLYDRARRAHSIGFWERIVSEACVILERDASDRAQLEDIAEQLKVSYPTFRKHFRAVTGVSPGEYRIRTRLEKARALLTKNPVNKVALELGYCDAFTFSAQFKEFVGMSPREFQQMMKQRPGG